MVVIFRAIVESRGTRKSARLHHRTGCYRAAETVDRLGIRGASDFWALNKYGA
jgi:hypothetical protein